MLPLVVTVTDAQGCQRTAAFAESPVIVGRGPFCQLRLDEPWISRQEGQLEFDAFGVTYLRMNPNGTTTVDGHDLEFSDDAPLRPNTSELVIGTLRIRVRRAEVPAGELWRESAAPAQPPSAVAKTMSIDIQQLREMQARGQLPSRTSPATTTSSQRAADAGGTSAPGVEVPPAREAQASETSAAGSASSVAPRPVAVVDGEDLAPHLLVQPSRAATSRPAAGVEAGYEAYRRGWQALFEAVSAELLALDEEARPARAKELQRKYPQLCREREFRELLTELGLTPHRPDIPELESWLGQIGREVLPTGAKLESGFTLDRMIELVTDFANMYIDIRSAQDEVRRVALGKQPPRSVLSSNEASVVLAYLLDPRSDWEERVAELRNVIRRLIQHDFAFTQATYDGARELLEGLSPEALAEQEGVALEREASQDRRSFWKSLGGGEAPEVRLWRRFEVEYEKLLSGSRYQRVFMGTSFARKYRRIMGLASRNVLPSSRPTKP